MDAIIGGYKVRMEETGLVLTHPTGIVFDLTLSETIGLFNFISVYQQSLGAAERETDPHIERIIMPQSDSECV